MFDAPFTDLLGFFNLSNFSHCHFTLGFNIATKVEMVILMLY